MRMNLGFWALVLCLFDPLLTETSPVSAQEARSWWAVLSAGPGGVQTRGRNGSWDFGPFLGGRVEWGTRTSAASLTVDVQPFRAEGTPVADEFRALYLLPAVAVGSRRGRLGFGAGVGVFDFAAGTMADGVEVGFVAGASGSARLFDPYFLELGWKRITNVRGLNANVWTLRLARRWRF